jgi:maltose O-acetyltransferase
VTIGDNVWLGAASAVLKGVTIGDNSVIGLGAVVTSDVPPDRIWAGNPARDVGPIPED